MMEAREITLLKTPNTMWNPNAQTDIPMSKALVMIREREASDDS